MNCKFHTDKESVTKCAVCGAEMCSKCKEHPYYCNDKDEPYCLDCSLQAAELELENQKEWRKFFLIRGIIASVIWFVGLGLFGIFGEDFAPIAIVLMIGAVIFLLISMGKEFAKGVVFVSDDFSGKVKTFFLVALFCPFYVIFLLILDKSNIRKANKKVKKIKSELNTN
jgi:hypothetical protein